MSAYGHVAVVARALVIARGISPRDAWDIAAATIFTESESSRDKLCPKGAFRGLCASGLVAGIAATDDEINMNGRYAVAATRQLIESESASGPSSKELWRSTLAIVGADVNKQHNSQMDVCLELFARNCINASKL